jgi:hypothetical protein
MTTSPRPLNPAKRPRVRNPRTAAKIQRDVLWQIAVPLGLAVLLALVAAVLIILPVGASARRPWADVTLIALSIPTLIAALVVLVIVVGLCAGMYFVLRELPIYFKVAQDFVALVSFRVQTIADQVSGVFLRIRSLTAGAQRIAKDVRRQLRRGG